MMGDSVLRLHQRVMLPRIKSKGLDVVCDWGFGAVADCYLPALLRCGFHHHGPLYCAHDRQILLDTSDPRVCVRVAYEFISLQRFYKKIKRETMMRVKHQKHGTNNFTGFQDFFGAQSNKNVCGCVAVNEQRGEAHIPLHRAAASKGPHQRVASVT
jgi:hypothetical protein